MLTFSPQIIGVKGVVAKDKMPSNSIKYDVEAIEWLSGTIITLFPLKKTLCLEDFTSLVNTHFELSEEYYVANANVQVKVTTKQKIDNDVFVGHKYIEF